MLCFLIKQNKPANANFMKAIYTVSEKTQPSNFLTDFERAAVDAFAYPESSIKGCYFQICQAFLRKANEIGLKKIYENDCELSLVLRLIPAFSFVPSDLVEQSFASVVEEIENVADPLDFEQ